MVYDLAHKEANSRARPSTMMLKARYEFVAIAVLGSPVGRDTLRMTSKERTTFSDRPMQICATLTSGTGMCVFALNYLIQVEVIATGALHI